MKVAFLRHGHAVHNEAYERNGDSAYENPEYKDGVLTEKGRFQAACVQLPFVPDCVFSSPLRRCLQTASIVAPDAPIYAIDELVERQCNHPCNTKSPRAVLEDYVPRLNLDGVSDSYPVPAHESDDELMTRGTEIFGRLFETGARNILIVGHWDFFRIVIGKEFKNCEVYLQE